MKNSKYYYKNSSKNDFFTNLVIVIISAIFVFLGANVFSGNSVAGSSKFSIVVYAVAVAVAYCRIAVETIEKLLLKRFDVNIISVLAVLLIFASQQFKSAALVAVVYSFCKCIFDLICADFSDKILSNSEEQLFYTVVSEEGEIEMPCSKLQKGDKIIAHLGDYLAFDYSVDGSEKVYKAGSFNLAEEKEVTVKQICDYEIDFSVLNKNSMSKTEKSLQIFTYVYIVVIFLFAVFMFAKSLAGGTEFYKSLYNLGLYLLFANPLTLNSGMFFAGAFNLISLNKSGVKINNNADLEKLANTKKIVFDESVVGLPDNTLNNEVVKAVRIAEVLKINTAYLGNEDSAAVDLVGFDECVEEIPNQIGTTYIGEKEEECKNTLKVSTNENAESFVDNNSLTQLVKSCKSTKWLKFFEFFRVAFGIVFNFVLMLVFSSNSIANRINNVIIENEGIEQKPLVARLFETMVNDNSLSPWIIAFFHLAIIIIFMFISMSFINKNYNKKLR